MRTILVPTDYSQNAHNALLYAIELAKATESDIVLFHAFYKPLSYPYHMDFSTVVHEQEREKVKKLEAYVHEARESLFKNFSLRFLTTVPTGVEERNKLHHTRSGFHAVDINNPSADKAKLNIKCVCKHGFAFDEILKAVDVHQADLVVMGTRGGGAIQRALLGRTTIAVMRDVHVPVLAVPQNVQFTGLKSIVFASDLSKLPSAQVFDSLRVFVKAFASKLQVLHLYRKDMRHDQQENALAALDTLDKHLHDIDYDVIFQQRNDAAEAIQDFMHDKQAELLVLMPQKHSFLETILSKSITERMMAKAFVPLLALPSVNMLSNSAMLENHREVQF
ncbi:universal stress protein [Pontibacter pamirensis]|uniref:universal stress protein n=1 Tax=Pontibacter pamirensis TaxID=2562824 RepID=UPI00138A18C1|nr:universal stress protein [Pontibacter pamirensis]